MLQWIIGKFRENTTHALFSAAINDGDYNLVKKCLQDGAVDANERLWLKHWDGEFFHDLPLSIATHNIYLDIVQLLLEYGANPDIYIEEPILIRHVIGYPIFNPYAFPKNDYFENAKLLLQFGANPNIRHPDNGKTALHYVAVGTRRFVDILMNYGADVNAQDSYGYTPLCSMIHEHIEIYESDDDDDSEELIMPLLREYFKYKPNVYLKLNTGKTVYEYIRDEHPAFFVFVKKVLNPKMRWAILRSCVVFLGLHQRAVVSANHPLRKFERGEFDDT